VSLPDTRGYAKIEATGEDLRRDIAVMMAIAATAAEAMRG
jgi:hypothetical protein